jgi:hypothetical protein
VHSTTSAPRKRKKEARKGSTRSTQGDYEDEIDDIEAGCLTYQFAKCCRCFTNNDATKLEDWEWF